MSASLEDLLKTVVESKSNTDKLVKEFSQVHGELRDTLKTQSEEIKQFGGTSTQTSQQLSALEKRFDSMSTELQSKMDENPKALEEIKKRQDELEAKMKRGGVNAGGEEAKSIGQIFVENDSYKKFNSDRNPRTERINIGSFGRGRKAGISGVADLRSVFSTYNNPNVIDLAGAYRTSHIRDHMNVVTNAPSIVNYIRETGSTNAAAFQIPATPNPEAPGAPPLKPLSSYGFEKDSAQAATIAHGCPITRQTAADIPSLVNRIDTRLREGLLHKEDTVILFQAGGPGLVKGITQHDIQQFTRGQVNDTMIDNVRRARTQIDLVGGVANLTVLSPEDWEEIELSKDDEKRYLYVQVLVAGIVEPVLWRVPVYVTNAMTEGQFLIGDFQNGATLWEHQQAFVQIFDQHSDWALRNQLLLLAEEEIIVTVEQTSWFVEGTFGSVGSGS